MSNEEHIEEMYYFAHLSGVFTEFSLDVIEERNKNPKKSFSDNVQKVFEEYVEAGLIMDEFHLFI